MAVSDAYPLIVFTLLSGTAFGLWTIVFALRYGLGGSEDGIVTTVRVAGWLTCILLVIGLAVSVLHLASPTAFYRALNNWATSWLSREVWFAGLFTGITIVSMVLYEWARRGKLLPQWLTAGIAGLGVLCGLAMTLSTGMSYMSAKGFPGWSNPVVTVFFPVCGLAVGLALGFALWLGRKSERPGARSFATAMFVLALLAALAMSLTFFGPQSLAASFSALELLVIIVLVLATWAVYALMLVQPKFASPVWVWVAFLVLAASVVLTRVWFYTYAVHL